MSLGDAIAWALPDLRSNADSTMSSTANVVRPGPDVFDPETGLLTPSTTAVLSSSARLRQPTAAEANVLFGEQDVTKIRFIVDFPHDVTGVLIDDVVTFSDSSDPEAVGRLFKVIGLSIKDHIVTRSIGVELVE